MNEHILVADDDAASRLLLKTDLERNGYVVTTVDDGARAMVKIQEIKPNLVILDVKMPGAYGPILYSFLQDDPTTAGIPVLFVSGQVEAEELVKSHQTPGSKVRFLAKPIDLTALGRVVVELLSN